MRHAPVATAVGLALALAVAACGGDSSADGSGAAATQSAAPAAATSAAGGGVTQARRPCDAGAKAPPSRVSGAPLDTILRVPARARGHRAPLVLALHFASGTGAAMEETTRLTPEAARSGFAVAYPSSSSEGFWSAGDDLGRLARTIDAIERVACIDRARVYVTGISNGGGMANAVACAMARRVAAVVLFAPAGGGEDCTPARPISVLEIHGTSDSIVPYSIAGPFVSGWARRDGCASRSTAQRRSARVTLFTWPGCRGGAQVQHLRLAGGEHIELLPQLRAAGTDPAHATWQFLSAHRLAAA